MEKSNINIIPQDSLDFSSIIRDYFKNKPETVLSESVLLETSISRYKKVKIDKKSVGRKVCELVILQSIYFLLKKKDIVLYLLFVRFIQPHKKFIY